VSLWPLRRLALSKLAAEPWRNGAGLTRTVACDALTQGRRWRVSVADLTAPCAFSRFQGMARQAVLVSGGPLSLDVAGVAHTLVSPGTCLAFDGDAETALRSLGQPSQFWNVMTRRADTAAELSLWRADEALPWPALVLQPGSVHLLTLLQGACTTTCSVDGQEAEASWAVGEVAVLDGDVAGSMGPVRVSPVGKEAVLLHTVIHTELPTRS
jgi:environmental stress-induced protein Ves